MEYVLSCCLQCYFSVMSRRVRERLRWIKVPVIGQLQPSEIVKIGMILFIAAFLGKHQEDIDRISFLLVFAVVAAIPLYFNTERA